MVARPVQGRVQPEVGGVHRGGLVDPALFEQQGTVGVPGGLHPPPRFVVRQCVVELDRAPQVAEGVGEIAFPVSDLTVEHGGCDGEDVEAGVVEQVAAVRDTCVGRSEGLPLGSSLGEVTFGGVGDAAAVMDGRRGVLYNSGSAGSGSAINSSQRPNRTSTCTRSGTNASSQSAIGGDGTASRSGVSWRASSSAVPRAVW